MALLKFLKGNYAGLSANAITEGQVLICSDTGEMFVDVAADKRVKIGDFVVVSTLEALEALDASTVPTSRLYYVEDGNILARSNGSAWVQINKQKTLDDLGGVSKSVYDAKIAALEAADKTNSDAIDAIEADYLKSADKSALEDKITEVSTAVATEKSRAEGIEAGLRTDVDDIKADYLKAADKTALQGNIDTLAGRVTANENKLAGIDTTVAAAIDADVEVETDARVAADNAIKATIGTVAEGKTVVQMIADAQTAATYDDTEVRGLISDNADAIDAHKEAIDAKVTALIGDDADKSVRTISAEEVAKVVAGADASFDTLKEIADWISSHKTDATAMNSAIVALEGIVDGIGGEGEKATVVSYVTDAIAALKIGDYAKAADLTALADRVSILETTVGKAADGGNEATGLVKAVADNAAAIDAEKKRAEKKEAELVQADIDNLKAAKDHADAAVAALGIADYVKRADADAAYAAIGHDHDDDYDAKGAAAGVKTELETTINTTKSGLEAEIAKKVDKVTGKSLVDDAEITKLAGVSEGANKVEASTTNGKIKIDGVETIVYTHPTSHTISEVTGLQDALDLKLEAADVANKADKATTLAGYGIADAYTKDEVVAMLTWGDF